MDVFLTSVGAELHKLSAEPPKGPVYPRLYAAILDGRLPCERAGKRIIVNLEASAELLGIKLTAAA